MGWLGDAIAGRKGRDRDRSQLGHRLLHRASACSERRACDPRMSKRVPRTPGRRGHEQVHRRERASKHRQAEFMQVDMSNLASVRSFASECRRRFDRLDLLINNAGVALPPQPYTADGFESHFGVNHLSHFLLTTLLFDLLKSARSARVVNVSSISHRRVSIEFDTLVKGTDWPWTRYGRSKLCNLLFTYELRRRLLAAKISNSSEMGALPTLYAATAEGVESGDYYGPDNLGGRRGYPVKETSWAHSQSKPDAERLWTLSEELTTERFDVA